MPPERPDHTLTVPADALALLQAVAVPLLQVDAQDGVRWANAAAQQALAAAAGMQATDLWRQHAADNGPQRQSAHSGHWFHLSTAPLADGNALWTLQPAQALHDTQAELQHQHELMDLAREFGRLGVWERDVRTLQGRWDREVLRFWGLDPAQGTPDFAEAVKNILPEDRKAIGKVFEESIKKAGHYSTRYRVRGHDGRVRRIHSQWLVKDGADGRPERVLGLMMDDTEPYALAQSAQELESQLALTVQLSGIAIWRHDLASARMHYSNQGWHALGLPPRPEGLTLDEVRQLIHPEDLPAVVASAEAAMRSTQPVDVEARYRHVDGSWRNQMLRRTVLRDDQGRPTAFLGVAMDVTERLEERRRTHDLLQRFETVTRAAGIGHWAREPGQAEPTWSEQLRLMFDLPLQAPVPRLGEWLSQHVHPDDEPALRLALNGWGATGAGHLEIGFRVRRANGELRQFHSHSRAELTERGMRRFGVVIDITDQRRSEQALQSAEERISLAVQGAGLGTWEQDLETLHVHWDAQMWHLRGLPPRARAMDLEERLACLHPDDRAHHAAGLARAVDADGTWENEFRVIWPDGQVRWLASRSVFITDHTGRRSRIGVNWDITASRTAETAQREREVALRESEAKSQFMARMSHELRTPLNAVLGFTQLLLADDPAPDAAGQSRRRRLEHISSAGQHLLSLINDVLQLSGLAGGEVRIALEPVPLQALLDSTLPLLGPLWDPQAVPVRAGPLDLTVMADATRLRQVLLNLLSNAIKYNRAGGQVRVNAQRQGPQVLLQVADDGCGMDEGQQRHLFEPFNRLGADRSAIEGTGIGLAIVKALVERMGGSITVKSQPGQGSVFAVSLAAADAPNLHVAAPPPLPGPPQDGAENRPRRQLLYIEDNPVNALIIGELLGRRGDLSLHVSVDGSSGVAQARALQPDLVLLDMQLPDFDGYEVLRRLRADPLTAAIPCIALSANAMPQDIERALKAGMSDYWTKPLDFKAFMASLDALFGAPKPADARYPPGGPSAGGPAWPDPRREA
jgi:hypothetical protein